VVEDVDLSPDVLVFVAHGNLPRTTSGKIRRAATREAFQSGTLKIMGTWVRPERHPGNDTLIKRPNRRAGAHGPRNSSAVTQVLQERFAIHAGDLDKNTSLTAIGIDSLQSTELIATIERLWGVRVPYTFILNCSIGELDAFVASAAKRIREVPIETLAAVADAEQREFSLSEGQKALWFVQLLYPEGTAYSISRAVRIRGPLNVDALGKSLELLAKRHQSLCLRISESGGVVTQIFDAVPHVVIVDATEWDHSQFSRELDSCSAKPFDLRKGPLVRFYLYLRSDSEAIMVFNAHHIALDLWSMKIFLKELGSLYAAQKNREPLAVEPDYAYRNYVSWQERFLSSKEAETQWNFWRRQLGNVPPPLQLPFARHGISQSRSRIDRTAQALE